MNYCPKCGAYIPDGTTKCVACGFDSAEKEKRDADTQRGFGGAAAQAKQEYRYEDTRRQEEKSYTGTVADDETRRQNRGRFYYDAVFDDAARNKGMGMLCYIGPFFLIPLLTRKNSPFIRFHANQGLVLFLMELAVNLCYTIPVIGWLAGTVGAVMVFISFISGIMNAANGLTKRIPFFGNISVIK